MTHSRLIAPGLKRRKNRDGTSRLYWAARSEAVKAGFQPSTVRLHYDESDVEQWPLIQAKCEIMQADMLSWVAGHRPDPYRFDGTIRGLSTRFQIDPISPFNRNWKWKTRETAIYTLRIIENAFGDRSLARLTLGDFIRWYDVAKQPSAPGKPERLRKAYDIIKMLRQMIKFGAAVELSHCSRLSAVLSNYRFKHPRPRSVFMTVDHVRAFIPIAVDMNRLSLALGTALQFETALRQGDVVGEWEPIPNGQPETGITMRGRRWINGLTWSNISPDWELHLRPTKTDGSSGVEIATNLKLCPLAFDLLQHVPADQRVGPIIIDEKAGRPYARSSYGREWRIVARAAGIPDVVQNRDARAGAITEGHMAGADMDNIRTMAGHTQASTTELYKRSSSLKKTADVQTKRLAHRGQRKE